MSMDKPMSDELKHQASIDTPEFRKLLQTWGRVPFEWDALIAHIDAWGRSHGWRGFGARDLVEAVNIMLWLYRRLPQAYKRPPFVEGPIAALAKIVGIEVDEYFRERGAAAPTPDKQDAPDAWRVPAGYKLVPIKSTAEMNILGRRALRNCGNDQASIHDAELCWSAMIDAAPAITRKEDQ